MREQQNRTREKWAFYRRTDLPNHKLAIFVHGFRGDYLRTWGALPEFLATNSRADAKLDTWDYVFLGYETSEVKTYLDIAALICGTWRKASAGEPPYDRSYDRFALLGHSLGTLGIRQALCANAALGGPAIQSVQSVTLFGSPLNGSKLASFGSFLSPIADALKPANPQLRMLKVWCEGAFGQVPWPKVRVVVGQGDWVVGHELAELVHWPGDLPAEATVLNHSDLSKPDDWANCSFMDYLRSALQ
jgi:hypothetical protein